jgi:hypothetical protein
LPFLSNLLACQPDQPCETANEFGLVRQVPYGRHPVRVFRFGLRLVGNEQAAEHLIGEVFLDVWSQAGKFEGRSAISTWGAFRDVKIPDNTVKTRLVYARYKLAELLKAVGVGRGRP